MCPWLSLCLVVLVLPSRPLIIWNRKFWKSLQRLLLCSPCASTYAYSLYCLPDDAEHLRPPSSIVKKRNRLRPPSRASPMMAQKQSVSSWNVQFKPNLKVLPENTISWMHCAYLWLRSRRILNRGRRERKKRGVWGIVSSSISSRGPMPEVSAIWPYEVGWVGLIAPRGTTLTFDIPAAALTDFVLESGPWLSASSLPVACSLDPGSGLPHVILLHEDLH